MSDEHPLAEGRQSRYGEPPTMPDIDPTVAGAPQERPDWWPDWWLAALRRRSEQERTR